MQFVNRLTHTVGRGFMKAIILAGGQGKRMRPLTENVPKTMVEVGGKPFIYWNVKWLSSFGIHDFVLSLGYKKEALIDYLDSKAGELKARFEYSPEDEPLGTGGAVKLARKFIKNDKEFVVTNSDFITNIDVRKMNLHDSAVASVAVVPMKSPYGIVELNGAKVTAFRQKPVLPNILMNAGIYLMSEKIFDYLPEKGEFETGPFGKLTEQGRLNATNFAGSYWRTADTIKEVEEISGDIEKGVAPVRS